MKNSKKKPDRWEFLNELDGRPTDTTPVRSLYRRPHVWEWVLYGLTALLWVAALVLAILEKYGAVSLLVIGLSVFCLRLTVFEGKRRKRCRGAILGTVETVTRRPRIRQNARYPVIRFAVDGADYLAYGQKPCHPSTLGNEVWVNYNIQAPADCYVTSDSRFKGGLIMTLVTAVLGIVFLMLEMS
ncbi:MAG: hypothetical protein IJD38_10510 [Clostridia bacterium]|nr:hypothetical protein [Clostridia bacterium]